MQACVRACAYDTMAMLPLSLLLRARLARTLLNAGRPSVVAGAQSMRDSPSVALARGLVTVEAAAAHSKKRDPPPPALTLLVSAHSESAALLGRERGAHTAVRPRLWPARVRGRTNLCFSWCCCSPGGREGGAMGPNRSSKKHAHAEALACRP